MAEPRSIANTVESTNEGIVVGSLGGGTRPVDNIVQGNLLEGRRNDNGSRNALDRGPRSETPWSETTRPRGISDVQAHPELGNVIAGNADNSQGIVLSGALTGSTGTIVAGNFVGVDRSGAVTEGHETGIHVANASGNQIGPGNVVSQSVDDGVLVSGQGVNTSSNHVRIVANSIYANGGLGIDLADGSNDNIEVPKLGLFGTTAAGTVTGNPGDTIFVEFFGNADCSESLNGAGRRYLDFAQVTIRTLRDGHLLAPDFAWR